MNNIFRKIENIAKSIDVDFMIDKLLSIDTIYYL